MTRTHYVLGVVCLAALAVLAVRAWGALRDARADAMAAGEELAWCRQAVATLQAARGADVIAGDAAAGDIIGRISTAASAAGIEADQVVRISPDSPSRLADTPYKEKPTAISLRQVSLPALTTFIHHLLTREAGLSAKSIHLTSPSEAPAGTWNAEVVVTSLLYEPSSEKRMP